MLITSRQTPPDSKLNHDFHHNKSPNNIPPPAQRARHARIPSIHENRIHRHPLLHRPSRPPKTTTELHRSRDGRAMGAVRSRDARRADPAGGGRCGGRRRSNGTPPRLSRPVAALHGARGRGHASRARVRALACRCARAVPGRARPRARRPGRQAFFFLLPLCLASPIHIHTYTLSARHAPKARSPPTPHQQQNSRIRPRDPTPAHSPSTAHSRVPSKPQRAAARRRYILDLGRAEEEKATTAASGPE